MNKISTYDELLAERRRLEADLIAQKAYIKNHMNAVRERLEPVSKVISFVGGFKSKPGSTLLKIGSNIGIDLLVRQKLKKAGWLAKLVLPLVLKFTASKTIDNVQNNKVQ